ncbi:MAG: hydrogenase iron-sulfur subunit, partial [Syntrophobacteraceae bacterium]|nr:hydrogenase iron-sulfur subunit [Syntrophobacteraceae bacterium]
MGDCHYLYGNVMTVKRMRFLQELLDFVGLGGRLHLEWISSAEARKFAQIATAFTEKLRGMGPSPVAVFTEEISAMGLRPTGASRPKTS